VYVAGRLGLAVWWTDGVGPDPTPDSSEEEHSEPSTHQTTSANAKQDEGERVIPGERRELNDQSGRDQEGTHAKRALKP